LILQYSAWGEEVNAMPVQSRGVVIGSQWVRSHIAIPHDQLRAGAAAQGQRAAFTRPPPEYLDSAIRRSLFYFDRIEWPQNDLMPEEDPRFSLLVEQGVIQRRTQRIAVSAWEAQYAQLMRDNPKLLPQETVAEKMRDAHIARFLEVDAAQSGQWAFLPIYPDRPFWGTQALADVRSIRLALHSVLPVPAASAHFAEVVEFRTRRHDQLTALRTHLDGLYQEVCWSEDLPAAASRALGQLEADLKDLDRVLAEGKLATIRANLSLDLIVKAAEKGEGAHAIAEWAGAGAPWAVGIVAGAIEFSRLAVKSPLSRVGPLEYLYHAHKEQLI
jgi:hypothetical protein